MSGESVYIEPSLTQLAAMAREDPESLESVSNFRVGHKRHGNVVWLQPVDVRGLNLGTLVDFSPGSINVRLSPHQMVL